jgi:hypothetical protein
VFLLFVGYEVCFIVLRGMSTPRSEISDGMLFLQFFWLCDEDDVELLDGGRCAWWWKWINIIQWKKVNIFVL